MGKIKITRLEAVRGGKTRAFFDFHDTELGLYFRNWKLAENRQGENFVAAPATKSEDGTWYNLVGVVRDASTKRQDADGRAWLDTVREAAELELMEEAPPRRTTYRRPSPDMRGRR